MNTRPVNATPDGMGPVEGNGQRPVLLATGILRHRTGAEGVTVRETAETTALKKADHAA